MSIWVWPGAISHGSDGVRIDDVQVTDFQDDESMTIGEDKEAPGFSGVL